MSIAFVETSSQYINVPHSASLAITGYDMAVSMWVYIDDTAESYQLLSKSNGNLPASYDLAHLGGAISGPPTDKLMWARGNGSVYRLYYQEAGDKIATATWTHVCASQISTTVYFYLNGVLQDTVTEAVITLGDASDEVRIGGRQDNVNYLDGKISEVAIWNTYLSAWHVQQMALTSKRRAPLAIKPANLVLYMPLDDFNPDAVASGADRCRDLSGNENHGTPTNSPYSRIVPLSYPSKPVYVE